MTNYNASLQGTIGIAQRHLQIAVRATPHPSTLAGAQAAGILVGTTKNSKIGWFGATPQAQLVGSSSTVTLATILAFLGASGVYHDSSATYPSTAYGNPNVAGRHADALDMIGHDADGGMVGAAQPTNYDLIGFFGQTPIAQPALAASTGTFSLAQLVQALCQLGLMQDTSGTYPYTALPAVPANTNAIGTSPSNLVPNTIQYRHQAVDVAVAGEGSDGLLLGSYPTAMVGFYGAAPVAQQTLNGSTATATNVVEMLSGYGLIATSGT